MDAAKSTVPNIETELTCSICTELLYQPLTLLDCLHTFCGACVKEWFGWQAVAAEQARRSQGPIATCPACRDVVRDSRNDARITTLLDMFLSLNPDRARSESDRAEMDGRYRRGENILPRMHATEASSEARELEEAERRLLDDVRELSLRPSARGSGRASSRSRRRDSRSRDGRLPSRDGREARTGVDGDRSRRPGSDGDQRRRQDMLQAGTPHVEGIRSRRGESRPQSANMTERRRRRNEHDQSSLRSLISTEYMDIRDLEVEIAEFARQIQEEGLLDGFDLNNIDLENNNELSRKITEAYRRRMRDRAGHGRSRRRSDASSRSRHSEMSDLSAEAHGPHDSSRPASSSGRQSREARANSKEERGRFPPSSSINLDVQESRRRRRSTTSADRSFSLPVDSPAPDSRAGSRSQTDLAKTSSRQEPQAFWLKIKADGHEPPPLAPSPLPPPDGGPLPLYQEPFISCKRCNREHIEYELHYNCGSCHGGEWNICLDCWRQRKGCLHWFGFGSAAWTRWERERARNGRLAVPHLLTGNRYLPPKSIPGGANGRRTLTHQNPKDRLQTGTFCSGCAAWTNACYWLCDICNDGDWGFCNDCVQTGRACSHALLPLAFTRPLSTVHPPMPTPPASPALDLFPAPSMASLLRRTMASSVPLRFDLACESCERHVKPYEPRHHCHVCTSKHGPDSRPGDYILCSDCYPGLVTDGKVAAENGPSGWRRCPQGHRMVVEAFHTDESGMERRHVLRDLVGGRKLRTAPYGSGEGDRSPYQIWSWQEGEGQGGSKRERLVCMQVAVAATPAEGDAGRFTDTFPPDGGCGMRATAGWGWYPRSDVRDELMFPKGADITEVKDVNGEWCHGMYMGVLGLFPSTYTKIWPRDSGHGQDQTSSGTARTSRRG